MYSTNKVFLLKITLTSAISNCYHSVQLWMLVNHQQITSVLHKNTRCRHHVCKTSEITDLLVLDHSVLWQKHLVSTVAWKWNDYCLDLNLFLNVDLLFTDSLTYKRVWYVGCIFFQFIQFVGFFFMLLCVGIRGITLCSCLYVQPAYGLPSVDLSFSKANHLKFVHKFIEQKRYVRFEFVL